MIEEPHYQAAQPPEGTATPRAVPWKEVEAARPVRVPPGTPAAPLHCFPPPPPQHRESPTVADIEEHFPGVRCWWGLYTCNWWAYIPTARGGCLREAVTPNALFTQISDALRAAGRTGAGGR
ncbi:hypothetical protein GCM10009527_047660 [Actinomadura nitritigenes]